MENVSRNLEWGGVKASADELVKLQLIRTSLAEVQATSELSSWIHSCRDTEVLRFLRHVDGKTDAAIKHMVEHALWRVSQYGAETVMKDAAYRTSHIHREIFWIGKTADGCPALVIRTQAHDGADYDEDPKKFMAVLTYILEQGRLLYGVGVTTKLYLILDRGPVEWKHKKGKGGDMDMSVIPNLANLFRHIYSTVMSHYPELLHQAKVVPSSWVFSMCYKVTTVVMDPASRSKFIMVRSDEVVAEMRRMFAAHQLPSYLGGSLDIAAYGPVLA
jgi:hypothetical protein